MSKMETLAVADTQKPHGAWLAAGQSKKSLATVAYKSQTQNLQTLLLSAQSASNVDNHRMNCMKHNLKSQLLDPSSVPRRKATNLVMKRSREVKPLSKTSTYRFGTGWWFMSS